MELEVESFKPDLFSSHTIPLQKSDDVLDPKPVEKVLDENNGSSPHMSPLNLYHTLARKERPKKINNAEDFEKFLMLLIQDKLDDNETNLSLHKEDLEIIQKRKAALFEKMKEMKLVINDDDTVSFWSNAQTGITLSTLAISVGSIFLGLPGVLVAGSGFLNSWVSAINFFFEGRRDDMITQMIPVNEAHELSSDCFKDRSKAITRSMKDWNSLAESLMLVIKNYSNIRELGFRNIKRG